MEDGVTAEEGIFFPSDINPKVGSHQGVEEDHVEAGEGKGGGGFISQLHGSIGSKEEAEEIHTVEKLEEVKEVKEEGEKGSGRIIDTLISIMPLGPKIGGASGGTDQENGHGDENDAFKLEEHEKGVGNGGAINKFISNFLHPKEGDTETKDADSVEVNAEVNSHGKGGEGGGILENILSHIPQSLPDDAAPTTDEASILIHSLVHD